MKRKAIYILSLLAVLVSCQEDAIEEWASTEVVFSTGNIATVASRANSSGWETTDRIGIYMVETGEALATTTIVEGADNKKYRPTAAAVNATLATDGDDQVIYYPRSGSVDFIAYYPYLATGTGTSEINNYQYPIDATNQAAAANFMVSRNATGKSKGSGNVSLDFGYGLSKLTMTLQLVPGNFPDFDPADISPVLVASLTAGYALSDGTITSSSDINTVNLDLQNNSGVYTVDAIMLPGTGTNRKIQFKFPVGGYVTWDIPDNIEFEAGYHYNYTIRLTRTEVTAEVSGITAWENITDISAPGFTAASWSYPNCYMYTPGIIAQIPLAKAYDMWRYHPYFRDAEASLSGTPTAELLWMDTEGLITSVSITNPGYGGVLLAYTGDGKTGNAVVAVKIDGVIRWSWHIWISAYTPNTNITLSRDPDQYPVTGGNVYAYDNNTDGISDFIFMDRNLGAANATAGDPGSKGLYYQWGRKDPFVGTSGWTTTNYTKMYNAEGEITSGLTEGIFIKTIENISKARGLFNIPHAVTEPQYMYIVNTYPWGMGVTELWGDNAAKSPFDPCPTGWRVPSITAWNNLTKNQGTWNNGYDFDELLGYYPAAGRRRVGNGGINDIDKGYYWSTTGTALSLSNGAVVNAGLQHATGLPIRCVKSLD